MLETSKGKEETTGLCPFYACFFLFWGFKYVCCQTRVAPLRLHGYITLLPKVISPKIGVLTECEGKNYILLSIADIWNIKILK